MARIRFEQVTKHYGRVVAVRELDLEVADREFMVLLGPSGCGKTTTLNMIAGLEMPSDGSIWFDDRVVTYMPPHLRDVAMVFQSYALYPHKSVYDNIAFGLRMRGFARDEIDGRVRDAASRLHIAHLLERRPNELSGGQRQRVALGRAMVRQPAVFLMDEPLSNLDAALRISMRAEIKQLHHVMGTTFVYVTHDQAEALTLADRICVMRDGVIQQLGTPDEVYDRPRNRFVASFLGTPPINYLEGELVGTNGALAFRRGGFVLPITPQLHQRLDPSAPRQIVLGVRPEDVSETHAATGEGLISGHVTTVLPVGSDRYLGLSVEGEECFFRVGKDRVLSEGAPVSLAVNAGRIHLFHPEHGESLLA
jgi:multiple sugar transport system ATP-binding protein